MNRPARIAPHSAVILPTLWSGPWIWREQRAVIAEAVPTVLEVDDAVVNWPIEATFDAAEAHCLDKLLAWQSPVILIGASFGGLLALRLALHRPDLVNRVIASGCPGLGGRVDLGFDLKGRFSLTLDEAKLARAVLFSDTSCVSDDELTTVASAVANRHALRRGARLIRALQMYDAAADLRRIAVPVTLIWGGDDQLAPVGPWCSLTQQCPHVDFHVVPAVGHVPMVEAPAAFNRILRDVLSVSACPRR